jgi:hypothetical protein
MEGYPGFSTPKLYACFTEGNIHYLIMEHIQGETASEVWDSLSLEEQENIGVQMVEQFRYLQSIPSQGYYGRVHHQAFEPTFPLLQLSGQEIFGPYDTYEQYISDHCWAVRVRGAYRMATEHFFPEEEKCFAEYESTLLQSQNRHPTLTHLDPTLKNVILVKGKEHKWEVVMVDLEHFGWLPAWTQAVALHFRAKVQEEGEDSKFNALVKDYGAPYKEEVDLHNNSHKWIHYPV